MRYKLQFTAEGSKRYSLQGDSDQGQAKGGPYALPYSPVQLSAILTALELQGFDPAAFSGPEAAALRALGLLQANSLAPDFHQQVGQTLFAALARAGELRDTLMANLANAKAQAQTLQLELRFDENAVALARFPWELLHDGRQFLLPRGIASITRYISYPDPTKAAQVQPPLRVLCVESRPVDAAALPQGGEQQALRDALQRLSDQQQVVVDELKPPTYRRMVEELSGGAYHVLHFDGHGGFGRLCPACRTLNDAAASACGKCQADLGQVVPQGYLLFEDEYCAKELVSSEEVGNAVQGTSLRLIFLSACQSAVVAGGSLFAGVAAGLILAGVPAVTAMQFTVGADAAEVFVKQFYLSMANGKLLGDAVADGRRQISLARYGYAWFTPVLYLRSRDEGRLFELPPRQ
jgi:CHAT domain-containing protein